MSELLIKVPDDSQSPTIEWSERLYDRIMEAAERYGGLYHDRELSIVGQGLDEEILVVCPAPRGSAVRPALRDMGFDPEPVDTDSAMQVYRIESRMETKDTRRTNVE